MNNKLYTCNWLKYHKLHRCRQRFKQRESIDPGAVSATIRRCMPRIFLKAKSALFADQTILHYVAAARKETFGACACLVLEGGKEGEGRGRPELAHLS